jgi:hypothetical protein
VSGGDSTLPASPEGAGTAPQTQFAAQQTPSASQQRGQLPFTGGEVPLVVLLGAITLAGGALLRRLGRSGVR